MADPPELAALLAALLADCDESQRQAITSTAAPLLVVAGAGAGKTRVLTRRIAWRIHAGSALAEHVLALTFTRKAAAELRARLAALGVPPGFTAGTFHAVALRELRRRAADSGRRPPVLLDSKAGLLADLLPERAPSRGGARLPPRRELISQLAAEIEWAAARAVAPPGYVAACAAVGRDPVLGPTAVAGLYEAYEREKRRRGVLDFDDLIRSLTAAIADDPDLAAVQRWRHRHIFVDELQDANPAQLALLDAWLGGRHDLCAVGDHRQAIYGWNGADPDAVGTFLHRHPEAAVVELATNYRSTPQVVAVASAALARRLEDVAPAARADGEVPSLRCYADEHEEAAAVVRALRLAHRPGRSWRQLAVLARTNAQLAVFEPLLHEARIPFRSGTGQGYLGRPAVRAALAELRRANGTHGFTTWLTDLSRDSGGIAAADEPGEIDIAELGQAADLVTLGRLGREYASFDPSPSADGFFAWAGSSLRADPSPGAGDAVELVTFHRAKGLEWEVVFVLGLEDGFVPIAHARTPDQLDEERRLLYVALTRATDELHCSWCSRRSFGRRTVTREPSPYLPAIDAARRDLERLARPDAGRARAAIAATREQLRYLASSGSGGVAGVDGSSNGGSGAGSGAGSGEGVSFPALPPRGG